MLKSSYKFADKKVLRALEQLINGMERAQFTHFIGCVKKGYPTREHDWHRVRLIRDWLGIEPDQADEDQQIEDAIESWANRQVRLTAPRKKKVAKVKVIVDNAATIEYRRRMEEEEAADEARIQALLHPVDEVGRKEAAIAAAIKAADEAIPMADLEEAA
jgi:hypothetical protein